MFGENADKILDMAFEAGETLYEKKLESEGKNKELEEFKEKQEERDKIKKVISDVISK